MKTLASHTFKNDKEILVGYLNRSDQRKFGVPDVDSLALCFVDGEDYTRTICLRPDEALVVIKLLSEAVLKSVKGYAVGLRK